MTANDAPKDLELVPTNDSRAWYQRRNPFKYFVLIVVSGAVGVGCMAFATTEFPESIFFITLLPALLGSIGVALAIDIGCKMEQDPFWQRVSSAVLWGALGAFVGLVAALIAILYFIIKEGSTPISNIDLHK
jgi:hypothetical protein